MSNIKNNKTYTLRLNESFVKEARNLQTTLVGGENLSSLLNKLLEQWIVQTKYFIEISPIPAILKITKEQESLGHNVQTPSETKKVMQKRLEKTKG